MVCVDLSSTSNVFRCCRVDSIHRNTTLEIETTLSNVAFREPSTHDHRNPLMATQMADLIVMAEKIGFVALSQKSQSGGGSCYGYTKDAKSKPPG